jgi:hypothetical protein
MKSSQTDHNIKCAANINVDIFGKINAYVVHSCDENGFHRRVQRASSCLIMIQKFKEHALSIKNQNLKNAF